MEVYRPSGTTSSWRSCLPSHRYVCHAEYRRRQECGLDLNFMLGLRDFRVWESSRFFDSFFFRWPRQRCSAAKSYHKEYTCNSLDGYNDCYNNYPALSAPWSHMLYLLLRTRMKYRKWQIHKTIFYLSQLSNGVPVTTSDQGNKCCEISERPEAKPHLQNSQGCIEIKRFSKSPRNGTLHYEITKEGCWATTHHGRSCLAMPGERTCCEISQPRQPHPRFHRHLKYI